MFEIPIAELSVPIEAIAELAVARLFQDLKRQTAEFADLLNHMDETIRQLH